MFSPDSFKAASFAPESWKGLAQVAPPVSGGGGGSFVYTARRPAKKKPAPYVWAVGGIESAVEVGQVTFTPGRLSARARRKKDERELLLMLH